MNLLLGLDLVEVERVSGLLKRWGEQFLNRVFQPGELRENRSHPRAFAEHVAGRFAAKEAAMKALGTGWRGISFRDIVIGRDPRGKPTLELRGRAKERAEELAVRAVEVSITHTSHLAAAAVALLTSEPDSGTSS